MSPTQHRPAWFAGVLLLALTSLPAPLLQAQSTQADTTDHSPGRVFAEAAEARLQAGGRENADSAIALLHRAVEIDPRYERALAGLATAHYTRVDEHGAEPIWYDTAVAYAERVVPLNPARGWYLLGYIYGLKGESAFAVDAFQRSLQVDSTYLSSVFWLGYRYFDMGQHHNGIPLQKRAVELNPRSVGARNLLGYSYFHVGRPESGKVPFQEALAISNTENALGGPLLMALAQKDYKRAIAFTDSAWRAEPERAVTWARRGEAHLFAGNLAEAERDFREALARDSLSTNQYTWKSTALPLAYLYRTSGRDSLIRSLIERSYAHADALMRRGQEPWNAYYQYAVLALLEGDKSRAIRWLRATHQAGMPGPVLIETDPLMSDLRGDPEYREVVERLRWRAKEIRKRLRLDSATDPVQ